jgi:hypothetical protein
VDVTRCTVDGETLVASEPGATLTLRFPPQAIAETKADDAVIQGALLGGQSVLRFDLPTSTVLPLEVEGFLEAVRGLAVSSGELEVPFGLILNPIDRGPVGVRARGPASPLASEGVNALWQMRVSADRLACQPTNAHHRDGDAGLVTEPLSAEQRGLILASGAAADVDRLDLSALGASLTAHLTGDAIDWDHDMALGRDRKVRFEQRGVLYPFGHRATIVQTAERIFDGSTAHLHLESVLTVNDPIRSNPDDGTKESRQLPFHEVQILTTSVRGVVKGHAEEFAFVRPDETIQPLRDERDRIQTEDVPPLQQELDNFHVPRTGDELAASGFNGSDKANELITESITLRDLEDQLARAEEESTPPPETTPPRTEPPVILGPDDPSPPPPPPPPPPADAPAPGVLQLLRAQVAEKRALVDQLQAQVNGFLAQIAPLIAIEHDMNALADQGFEFAKQLKAKRAEIEALNARIQAADDPVERLFLPVRPDGEPVLFDIRCAGRMGDVSLRMPLVFVNDFTVPPDEQGHFEGYSSLADPDLNSLVNALIGTSSVSTAVTVPGVAIDLVRRPDAPRTTDIQLVHGLTFSGVQTPSGFRPVVDSFAIALPEVRTLVPTLPEAVPAKMSDDFLRGVADKSPVRLSPALPIGFDQLAERGGGLLTPSFDADCITEEFGPVDIRSLPGSADPLAAFAKMKLLGVQLSSLLLREATRDVPPAILQLMENGVPTGVRMRWESQRLKSTGPFVARAKSTGPPDTTTLDLEIEQTREARTTKCTISAFHLKLPSPELELLEVAFDSLVFRQRAGDAPTMDVGKFAFTFAGALKLIEDLQKKVPLGDAAPTIAARKDGISAAYHLQVPVASAGVFSLRNVVVHIVVDIPFRGGSPSVSLGFARRDAPFQLSVAPFGGGGYLQIGLDASGLKQL